jgi:type IV pilus assembly protein PilM
MFDKKPSLDVSRLKKALAPLLSTTEHGLLGMDISSSAIKLVELSSAGRGPQLERYVVEPLPKDAVVEGNIQNMEAVAEAIRHARRHLGSSQRVAIAPPTAMAIYKKILRGGTEP